MSPTIIFIGLAIVLLILVFLSRRRFGWLALALAAGYVLGQIWSYEVGLFLQVLNVVPDGLPLEAVSTVVVTLLPMLILLFRGPKYNTTLGRIVSAILTVVLASTLLAEPLQQLAIDENIYSLIATYKNIIVGFGLILATIDLLVAKFSDNSDKRSRR